MDINEIRDIMDLATKLQSTFKNIRCLCAKYQQLEKDGNNTQTYNNFSFIPSNYGHLLNFPHYQTPYNPNFAYNQQMNPNFPPNNTFPVNNIQEMASNFGENKQIQHEKNPQNKTESNQTFNYPSQQKSNNRKPNPSSQTGGCPQSPYHVFLMKKKCQIKNEYPHLGEKQLVEIMLEVWKSFTDEEKKPYELEFKRLKYNFLSKTNEEKPTTAKQINPDMIKNLKNQLIGKTLLSKK